MTVAGMIEQYNMERPNSVEDSVKMEFLRKCETNILNSVILLYDPNVGERTEEEWMEHLQEFDLDTELAVQEPFDDLYGYWLDQRIAMDNNDTKRFNVSTRLFDNMFLAFKQKYNRDHFPRQVRKKLLRHEVL
ncbi:MAG: hypothetical protein IKN47_06945 [Lachnospiraceae bacterium]|nr:hypothetical protein [Lachnospiraceae bacterium]